MKKYTLFLYILMISAQVYGQIPIYFNFDTLEGVEIDTANPGNIWQIGRPQKTIFNSSLSGQRAILTDTINIYPSNTVSDFVITVPTYRYLLGNVALEFYQKFDSDSLIDGGTIEVSYDRQNWMNIYSSYGLDSGNLFSINDTVSALQAPGFSGRSQGWELIHFGWMWPPSDTISIKFKFASDGINNNREGWMIDSLAFYYSFGLGLNQMNDARIDYSIYPNPVIDRATLNFNNPGNIANRFILINSCGDLIYEMENIYTDHILIDRTGIVNGMYFFYISSPAGNVASGKIVFE